MHRQPTGEKKTIFAEAPARSCWLFVPHPALMWRDLRGRRSNYCGRKETLLALIRKSLAIVLVLFLTCATTAFRYRVHSPPATTVVAIRNTAHDVLQRLTVVEFDISPFLHVLDRNFAKIYLKACTKRHKWTELKWTASLFAWYSPHATEMHWTALTHFSSVQFSSVALYTHLYALCSSLCILCSNTLLSVAKEWNVR